MNAENYLKSIGLDNVIDEEFFNGDDKSWYKVQELMEGYSNTFKEKVAAKYQSSIDHLEKEKEHFSKLDDQYSYNIACDEITQWKQAISILNETTNE